MSYLVWQKGKPYLYKSVRVGKKVKSVYIRSYAEHLKRGGEYYPATKKMTSTQIKMMGRITHNVGTYQELRRQRQAVAFKPYSSRYYVKWEKEFGL
jgi:hypothetical protein